MSQDSFITLALAPPGRGPCAFSVEPNFTLSSRDHLSFESFYLTKATLPFPYTIRLELATQFFRTIHCLGIYIIYRRWKNREKGKGIIIKNVGERDLIQAGIHRDFSCASNIYYSILIGRYSYAQTFNYFLKYTNMFTRVYNSSL